MFKKTVLFAGLLLGAFVAMSAGNDAEAGYGCYGHYGYGHYQPHYQYHYTPYHHYNYYPSYYGYGYGHGCYGY